MAQSKQKITPIRQAYLKEVKRLKNYQRRAEKKGYTFSQPLAPAIPKRVTKKKLEEIKSIKPRKIRGTDTILDKRTGEIIAEYIPTVTNFQHTEELIKQLPSDIYTRQGYTEMGEMKDTMLGTLYDTLLQYDSEDDYDDYLGTVLSDIQSDLAGMEYSSNQSTIYTNYSNALTLIKGSPLSMAEAKTIADYTDMIDDYE